MNISEIYGALSEKIDLTNQSPIEVLTKMHDVMDSVDPKNCAHTIKDGIGLYIRDCNREWEPTEKNTFNDDVYGALSEKIDLTTQTPFQVVTELYEIMDFVGTVTPVGTVNEALGRYLRDNGWSPEP